MIHRLAPGTTIKPGAEDRKVWVCVFVSVALSRELLRPVLSALCCFRALQSQIFIPAEIGLYRRRGKGGGGDRLNLATHTKNWLTQTQTCKHRGITLSCALTHRSEHAQKCTRRRAYTHSYTVSRLCGCWSRAEYQQPSSDSLSWATALGTRGGVED